jgi:hypothetical protein
MADIGTVKSILSLKQLFINLFEGFEMILHTLVIRLFLRIALAL